MTINLNNLDDQPRVRRSAYIADCLRDMIFNGTLKPGDRLPTEEQLCQRFNVSRTTLRESVQMLRVSGLLEVTPGRGSYVSLPDLSHLMEDIALFGRYGSLDDGDMVETRILLESALIDGAVQSSSARRKALQTFMVSPELSQEDNEKQERSWHLAMAEIAGNPMMKMFLEMILNLTKAQRLEAFHDMDEVMRTVSVQIRINEALGSGDAEAAKRVMTAYIKQISALGGASSNTASTKVAV